MHLSEDVSGHHREYRSAYHIDECGLHPERAEEHRYGYLAHQGRGDEEGQGNSQGDASLHEADKQGDGRARTERRDASEEGCHKIVKSVELVGGEVSPQPLDGEIGVDDAHHEADTEQQKDDLHGVVHEEVDRHPKRGAGIQTEDAIHQPVCESLNHKPSNSLTSFSLGTRPFIFTSPSTTMAGVERML